MTSDSYATAWRLELARQIARSYAANPKARVIMAAGSTGRGTADRYSDLELDVYWSEAPTDAERAAAVAGSGGRALHIFPYEEDEWAEEIDFGGFKVGTSTFLVATMERYLDDVLVQCRTDPLAQMRLYSVLHARLLHGDTALVADWQAVAARYPDGLVEAMLRENLSFEGFGYAEDMLAARDDAVMLYDAFVRVERQILGALLGLNRIYLPNPGYKSLAELVGEMRLTPPDLLARLRGAFRQPPEAGVQTLHAVIADVFDLVEHHRPDFDTQAYRERLAQRRGAWDGPVWKPEVSS